MFEWNNIMSDDISTRFQKLTFSLTASFCRLSNFSAIVLACRLASLAWASWILSSFSSLGCHGFGFLLPYWGRMPFGCLWASSSLVASLPFSILVCRLALLAWAPSSLLFSLSFSVSSSLLAAMALASFCRTEADGHSATLASAFLWQRLRSIYIKPRIHMKPVYLFGVASILSISASCCSRTWNNLSIFSNIHHQIKKNNKEKLNACKSPRASTWNRSLTFVLGELSIEKARVKNWNMRYMHTATVHM